ncbi:hypothetical protein M0805_001545 [Coniferiporia weirii]|nr:hypothetical protein M0805_001545 [Coniferiporia weirii]
MVATISILFTFLAGYVSLVSAHSALWHPSMWGFNVTSKTFSYDNRPVVPLMNLPFSKWWFHGHLDYPPNDGDFLEIPAGETMNTEIACDKGATSYFASSPGGSIQDGENPCPGSPTTAFHANNEADTRGCALAITHQSDVSAVKPEDFTIFSVNHTCVWNRFTNFDVPAQMPACPEGGCICAFFWIHAPDSGSEQIFMNGYRCQVTGATSTTPVATSRVARRCGADPDFSKPDAAAWNCTYGAKQPLYWDQTENNNMFEGVHAPPFYNDLYAFPNGAQSDIFQDSELPVFNEAGEQTGVTTLGSSTVTTAIIVSPTVSGSWQTTASEPGVGSNPAPTKAPSPGSSSSPKPHVSSSAKSSGSIAKNVAQPATTPAPSSVLSSSSIATPASSTELTSIPATTAQTSDDEEASEPSSSKCRRRKRSIDNEKRNVEVKKRALGMHKRNKRHDLWL